MATKVYHLILSGSGARIPAFLGAMQYMQDQVDEKLLARCKTIIASSGGAFLGLLIALGYSLRTITCLSQRVQYEKICNIKVDRFLDKYGLDDGEKFVKMTKFLIAQKLGNPEATFQELFDRTGKHLMITGTNVTKMTGTVFDFRDYPSMELWNAMRISMSLPFMFTVNTFQGDFFADGGILNSFPINVTSRLDIPKRDTIIGIDLEYVKADNNVTDIVSYVSAIVKTMSAHINTIDWDFFEHDERYELLRIQTSGLNSYDLNLGDQTKQFLFDTGFEAARNHFQSSHRQVRQLVKKIMTAVVDRYESIS